MSAGEQIMLIVPENDTLTVEARILPKDIDQAARTEGDVALHQLNQRTTPEINGEVSRVAADVTDDDQPYYLIRIKLDAVERLGKVTLTPDMPVEAFIQTRDRTMLSYLTKPLVDQSRRAFQERRGGLRKRDRGSAGRPSDSILFNRNERNIRSR